ncbi:hypothetical protein KYJ26_20390 [Bacillus sp. MCCB 382]|uniref:hypothetical protein n=1 Tax=Bacillus sp. MCCB 382 TaxID=2860197 RepID=UPI001C587469|nr:hypothetical protein [Bacillus sp. MCCB 382]
MKRTFKISKVWHPYYCVGCGEILKNRETFEPHYRECFLGVPEVSSEEAFAIINSENVGDR